VLKKVLTHAAAFIAGGILMSGTTVALATNSNVVQAIKSTFTIYANGTLYARPPRLVYKGDTYIQLSSIQHALTSHGIITTWDGNNFKMTIPFQPPAPSPNRLNILDMPTFTTSDWHSEKTWVDNLRNTYRYGGLAANTYVTYLLNGEFKKLTGTIAVNSSYNRQAPKNDVGEVKIIGDGQVLYDSGTIASTITSPISVNVDLTGVTQLEVDVISDDDSTWEPVALVNTILSK
jgi:hypothetical protein